MGGKVLVPTQEAVQKLIAARLAAGRDGRADGAARQDRRGSRRYRHHRRGRQRQALPHRRAGNVGGLLQDEEGLRPGACRARPSPTPSTPTWLWCETGTPDLAFAKKFAEGIRKKFSRQDAGLQLLAVVQLESAISTTRRSPSSSARSAPWATSSSSSRWPASTRSTTRCSKLAYGYARNNMTAFVELQEKEFAAAAKGFQPRSSTSARSAPATSTRSRRWLPPARPPPLHCTASTEDEQFFGEDALSQAQQTKEKRLERTTAPGRGAVNPAASSPSSLSAPHGGATGRRAASSAPPTARREPRNPALAGRTCGTAGAAPPRPWRGAVFIFTSCCAGGR